MSILIHLNGPPGVGKSTLAQMYVDEHPGTLNLDIDTVASLIGGWRDDFFGVLAAARNLAIAMIDAHLRTGCDVVMPQLVTSVEEAQTFLLAAEGARAGYIEVALDVDPAEQMGRFSVKGTFTELNTHIDCVVAEAGGEELLELIRRQLQAYLAQRPEAVRLDTTSREVSKTYAQLVEVLTGR